MKKYALSGIVGAICASLIVAGNFFDIYWIFRLGWILTPIFIAEALTTMIPSLISEPEVKSHSATDSLAQGAGVVMTMLYLIGSYIWLTDQAATIPAILEAMGPPIPLWTLLTVLAAWYIDSRKSSS
jgi:hypothetical protein